MSLSVKSGLYQDQEVLDTRIYAGDREVSDLANVFNHSITNGICEDDWLHSDLANTLPKIGKDHTKLQDYRIITVQNTVGKLLEKIIKKLKLN